MPDNTSCCGAYIADCCISCWQREICFDDSWCPHIEHEGRYTMDYSCICCGAQTPEKVDENA